VRFSAKSVAPHRERGKLLAVPFDPFGFAQGRQGSGQVTFAYWPLRDRQTYRYFNRFPNKSKQKNKKFSTEITEIFCIIGISLGSGWNFVDKEWPVLYFQI